MGWWMSRGIVQAVRRVKRIRVLPLEMITRDPLL